MEELRCRSSKSIMTETLSDPDADKSDITFYVPSKGKRWCSAPDCTNFRGKVENLSFFKFPKDLERCRIWIKNSAREDLFKRDITTLYDSGLCLCAEHFDVSMFMNPEHRNKLVSNAVPTIFPDSVPRPMILMPPKPRSSRKRKHISKKKEVPSESIFASASVSPNSNHINSVTDSTGSWNSDDLVPQEYIASPQDPAHGPNAASFDDGPFRPRSYELPFGYFPKRKFGQSCRSFQETWYLQYPWLEYSITKDASYCFYCRLFAPQLPFRPERPFVYEGYRYWKNASLDMRLHCNSKLHIQSKAAYDQRLRGIGEGSAQHFEVHAALVQEIQHHKKGISKIIDIVLFLGRQGLMLKAEQPDGENHFLEFLKWHAKDDAELIPCVSQPLLYTNILNQVELVHLCIDSVRKGIVSDVNELADGYFALICDEFVNQMQEKQISVCIRYVTKHLQVYERFLGYWRVEKIDDEGLCTYLQAIFGEVGLSESKMRSLSFGALGARTTRWKAIEARMCEEHPAALHVWCHIRPFDRLFWELCQHIRPICNAANTVNRFYNYITSFPKCRSTFQKLQIFEETQVWETSPSRSIYQQWASSPKHLMKLRDNVKAVVESLKGFADEGGMEGAEAEDLLESFEKFEFFCFLHICHEMSSLLEELSRCFEDPMFTVDGLLELVGTVTGKLKQMKEGKHFKTLFEELKQETDQLGIEPPPVLQKPGEGNSATPQSIDEIYQANYIEICQLIEQELMTEFQDNSSYKLLIGMDHLITNRVTALSERQANYQKVLKQFPVDFDRDKLMNDMKQFYDTIDCDSESTKMDLKSVGDIVAYFISNNFTTEFPEFHRLLKFYLLMPLIPPHPEKAFSVLKRCQNFQESTSLELQLEDSVVLAMENEEALKLSQPEILDGLADKYAERIFQSQYMYSSTEDIKTEMIVTI